MLWPLPSSMYEIIQRDSLGRNFITGLVHEIALWMIWDLAAFFEFHFKFAETFVFFTNFRELRENS